MLTVETWEKLNLTVKKSLLYEHELQSHFKLQNSNTASYLKIQLDSIFSQYCLRKLKTGLCTYFFVLKILTAQTWPSTISDYKTKTEWKITLLSCISLYTTVLVFLDRYQFQSRKISYSKKKNSKYKTDINYKEKNKLFKVQKWHVFLSSWLKIVKV